MYAFNVDLPRMSVPLLESCVGASQRHKTHYYSSYLHLQKFPSHCLVLAYHLLNLLICSSPLILCRQKKKKPKTNFHSGALRSPLVVGCATSPPPHEKVYHRMSSLTLWLWMSTPCCVIDATHIQTVSTAIMYHRYPLRTSYPAINKIPLPPALPSTNYWQTRDDQFHHHCTLCA